ncbi:MAG: hypothetical protein CMB47_01275 [Euryarchaeota archaeon]|nr:hypothetical protein [Euryarchaeota archaeon]
MAWKEEFQIKSRNIETPLPKNVKESRKKSEESFNLERKELKRPNKNEIIDLINNGEVEIAKRNVIIWLNDNSDDIEIIEMMILIEREREDELEVSYWSDILQKMDATNKVVKITKEYFERKFKILSKLSEKEWENCIEICNEILVIDKNNKFALISLARSYRGLEDYEMSVRYWNRIIKLGKLYDEEVLECCNSFYNNKKYKDVIRIISFRNSIEYSKEILEIYVRSLFNLKSYEDCIEYCEKLLIFESRNLIALRLMSKSMIILGKIIEAKELLRKRLDIEGENVEIYENLIEINLRMDQRNEVEGIWKDIKNGIDKEIQKFLIAVEISMKFNWMKRYRKLVENKQLKIDGKNFNIDLARITLDNGNIFESYKYLKLSDKDEIYENILNEIKNILHITNTSIDEIENEDSEMKWISTLVVRELSRKRNISEIRNNVPKFSIITSTLNRGGAERQVALTMKGMYERGFNCYLAVDRTADDKITYLKDLHSIKKQIEILSDIDTEDKNILGYDLIEENIELLNLLNSTTKNKIKRLVSYFIRNKPDVIHAWQDETILTAFVACCLTDRPRLIGSARSLRPDEKSELHIRKRPYLRECMKMIVGKEWFTFTINSKAGRKSYAEWLQIDEDNIKIIHNGTDFESMERGINIGLIKNEIVGLGICEDNIIVGGVFRLESGKRPKLWIDILHKLILKDDRIRGILVGGGKMENSVRKWIKEIKMENKIKVVGEKSDVAGWLTQMDIFLLTSASEGLPNAVIEAQGFGVPVVSTDVGGVSEIVMQGVTGELFNDEDTESVVDIILSLVENNKHKDMQIPSKENIRRKFSLKRMIDDTENMYNEVFSAIN